jgi:hypothetical protein
MRRILGTLVTAAALTFTAGCGSATSSTADGPDSPSAGPITGAQVLPLISMTGGGGRISTTATLLDTPAHVQSFSRQFRAPALERQITAAVDRAKQSGYLVYGAVVGMGCDRPPGADVSLDANGDVRIVAHEVASPLPECLAPVTTVAIATVPGAQ